MYEQYDHEQQKFEDRRITMPLILTSLPVSGNNPSPVECDYLMPSTTRSLVSPENFTPRGHVALDFTESNIERLHTKNRVSSGFNEFLEGLQTLGVDLTQCKHGDLVKGSVRKGIRITMEEGAYRRMCQGAVETLLDPAKGADLLGISEDNYRHQLRMNNSLASRAITTMVRQGGLVMEEMTQGMHKAAKNDLQEVAATLRDMVAARRKELGIPDGPREHGAT